MSLKLSKNNTKAYDYVSIGDNSNPISVSVIIDKVGGTKTSAPIQIYLIASQEGNTNIGNYSSIVLTAVNPNSDITWQMSVNDVDWVTTLSPATMTCNDSDSILPIKVRTVANNAVTTSLDTMKYYSNITVEAVENPA